METFSALLVLCAGNRAHYDVSVRSWIHVGFNCPYCIQSCIDCCNHCYQLINVGRRVYIYTYIYIYIYMSILGHHWFVGYLLKCQQNSNQKATIYTNKFRLGLNVINIEFETDTITMLNCVSEYCVIWIHPKWSSWKESNETDSNHEVQLKIGILA